MMARIERIKSILESSQSDMGENGQARRLVFFVLVGETDAGAEITESVFAGTESAISSIVTLPSYEG